jgi:hypothetical protein
MDLTMLGCAAARRRGERRGRAAAIAAVAGITAVDVYAMSRRRPRDHGMARYAATRRTTASRSY